MNIRPATADDLPLMADLWQERRVILSQIDPRFVLSANEREAWLSEAQNALTSPSARLYVAYEGSACIGYIRGTKQEQAGIVEEMALDAHRYHGGLGRELVRHISAWMKEQGAENLTVSVPRRMAVEQAFWRSLGAQENAQEWTENAWTKTPRHLWIMMVLKL
ncbi:MAG: GNAT family N-acetyltransferase [bacterium]|nr:GNAT family N-acetyltransferase [bacterium]